MTKMLSTQTVEQEVPARRYWRRHASRTGSWWPWGWLPVISLICVFVYGYVETAPAIEAQTAERVRTNLEAHGWQNLSVVADGQDVLIRGIGNEFDRDRILAWAQNTACATWIAGERICPNTVEVALTPPNGAGNDSVSALSAKLHNFSFIERDDELVLSGVVPSADVRDAIIAVAESAYLSGSYSSFLDDLIVSNETATDGFDWAVDRAWPFLRALDDGQVEWRSGRFSVSGSAPASTAEGIRSAFNTAAFPTRLGVLDLVEIAGAD